MPSKSLKGIIIKKASPKTLLVEVEFLKVNRKYQKRFKVSKRYQVHYEEGDFSPGDKVVIEESRPI